MGELRGERQPTLPLERYGYRGGEEKKPTWLWSQNSLSLALGQGRQMDGEVGAPETTLPREPREPRDSSTGTAFDVIGPDLDSGVGAKGRQQSRREETLMCGGWGTWTCGIGWMGRRANCH